jgi:hypothetical protein
VHEDRITRPLDRPDAARQPRCDLDRVFGVQRLPRAISIPETNIGMGRPRDMRTPAARGMQLLIRRARR